MNVKKEIKATTNRLYDLFRKVHKKWEIVALTVFGIGLAFSFFALPLPFLGKILPALPKTVQAVLETIVFCAHLVGFILALIVLSFDWIFLRDEDRFWKKGLKEERCRKLGEWLYSRPSVVVSSLKYRYADNRDLAELVSKMNHEAYKNTKFYIYSEEELFRRNLAFIDRNPKTFQLYRHPFGQEGDVFIAFTCLLPLTKPALERYLKGRVRDADIRADEIALNETEIAGILLFSAAFDPEYTSSFSKEVAEYLLKGLQIQFQELAPIRFQGRCYPPIYTQSDKRLTRDYLINYVRFLKKPGHKTGNGCDLYVIEKPFRGFDLDGELVKGAAPRKYRNAFELYDAGLIEPSSLNQREEAQRTFSMKTTSLVSSLIEQKSDAVTKQYVPSPEELMISKGEADDPVGDFASLPIPDLPKLIQKYPDRVLIKIAGVCKVHCRFCFRRNSEGPISRNISEEEFERILKHLSEKENEGISEVILSGGDPLILEPDKLKSYLKRLAAIDHIRYLRIHTRLPIVSPEEVSDKMIEAIATTLPKPTWVAVHCNHASELTPDVVSALARFVDNGIPLVSQTVLLKGVNDGADELKNLFRALVSARVKPYYIHHCDMVKGSNHFRTSLYDGIQLMNSLEGNLSGLCLPRYMLDIPGGFGKIPVVEPWVECGKGEWNLRDFKHGEHRYPA